MVENNTTCVICGKGYHLCMTCKDKMTAEPWRIHTDTSEHFKVFAVINGYNSGVYSKDEAKDKLLNIDLSDSSDFKPDVLSVIKDIMQEENKVVDNKSASVKRKTVKTKETIENNN